MNSKNGSRIIYLENGVHMTNTIDKETHCHYTRNLRNNKFKINIIISRPGWTHEIFETVYCLLQKKVLVLHYNFKLLESSVKNTNSLKFCGKEQVYDYYLKYIDTNLIQKDITWK